MPNPYMFTARNYDTETGLYYYRARYYDPSYIGRFLQPDPIGYKDSMNLYIYVGNNPIVLVDPFGFTYAYCPGGVGFPGPYYKIDIDDAFKPLAIDWEASKPLILEDTIAAIDAYEKALPYVKATGIIAGGLATLGTGAAIGTPATTTYEALTGTALFYGGTSTAVVGTSKLIAAIGDDTDYVNKMPNSLPGAVGMGFGGRKGAIIGDLGYNMVTGNFRNTLTGIKTGLSLYSGGMDLYNEFSSPK